MGLWLRLALEAASLGPLPGCRKRRCPPPSRPASLPAAPPPRAARLCMCSRRRSCEHQGLWIGNWPPPAAEPSLVTPAALHTLPPDRACAQLLSTGGLPLALQVHTPQAAEHRRRVPRQLGALLGAVGGRVGNEQAGPRQGGRPGKQGAGSCVPPPRRPGLAPPNCHCRAGRCQHLGPHLGPILFQARRVAWAGRSLNPAARWPLPQTRP